MTVKRLDHVTIVVEDMDTAVAFFEELGLELEGTMTVEGDWVDRVNGIEGVKADIAMLRTPDGQGKLELTVYRNPPLIHREPRIEPQHSLGIRQVMFAVDDLGDTVRRLQAKGATLMGEITQYEDIYRLCYLRGPAGIIVALAEALG